MLNDENSIVVPDFKKSKKGLRYRLLSLKDLHLKFSLELSDIECSYETFTRFIPEIIIKPKPEDWGTCLCMTCLNPELKLEAIKRTISNVTLTVLNLKEEKYNKEIENTCNKIKDTPQDF